MADDYTGPFRHKGLCLHQNCLPRPELDSWSFQAHGNNQRIPVMGREIVGSGLDYVKSNQRCSNDVVFFDDGFINFLFTEFSTHEHRLVTL